MGWVRTAPPPLVDSVVHVHRRNALRLGNEATRISEVSPAQKLEMWLDFGSIQHHFFDVKLSKSKLKHVKHSPKLAVSPRRKLYRRRGDRAAAAATAPILARFRVRARFLVIVSNLSFPMLLKSEYVSGESV